MTNPAGALRSTSAMPPKLPRRTRGFTLIEMIAAFVIFAIAVGALLQILAQSMNNARFSRDETRAALWAQSKLDTLGIGEPIEAGSSHGEFDRTYRWQLEIEQIDPELFLAEARDPSAVAPVQSADALLLPQIDLFHVALTVIWGQGNSERQAVFSTLRTARSEEPRNAPGGRLDLRGSATRNVRSPSQDGSR